MKAPRLICVGELLWDELPGGARPGGAPSNVAIHAAALGLDAAIISAVGQDERGRALMRKLREAPVNLALVESVDAPTGRVGVQIDAGGKPQYDIVCDVAWDQIRVTPAALEAVRHCDAISFGTLAQRSAKSRESIRLFLDAAPAAAWRVFDVNLRGEFANARIVRESLEHTNLLKVSDEELDTICAWEGILAPHDSAKMQTLVERYSLRLGVLSKGADGVDLFSENAKISVPAAPAQVVDTVGAGDSFTAALITGLLLGMQAKEAAERAVQIASFVCGKEGATPSLPPELLAMFHLPTAPESKASKKEG